MFLGITLFTAGARLIPSAQASLLSLLEVILAPVLVWVAFAEQPSTSTLIGGVILLVTLAAHTVADVNVARAVVQPHA